MTGSSHLHVGTLLTLGKKRGDLGIIWTKGEPERACPHAHLLINDG